MANGQFWLKKKHWASFMNHSYEQNEDFTKIASFMNYSYAGFIFLDKNKSYEHSGVLLRTFQCRHVGMFVCVQMQLDS